MTTRDNEPLPDDRTDDQVDQDRDQYQGADGALSSDGREPGQLPDAVGPDSQAPGMRDHDPMLDRDDLTARTDGPLQGSDALTRDDTVASDNDRGLDPGIGSDDRASGYADQPRGEDGTLTGQGTPRDPGTTDSPFTNDRSDQGFSGQPDEGHGDNRPDQGLAGQPDQDLGDGRSDRGFGDGGTDQSFGDGRTDGMSQPADPTAEGTDPSYATGTSQGDQTAVDTGALTTDGPTGGGSSMTGDVRAAEGAGGTYGGDTDSHDTGTGAFTDGDTRLDDDTRVDDAVAGDEQYTQNTDANYGADAGTANPTYGSDATASDARPGGTDGAMAATAATGLDTSGPGDLSASPGAPTSASGLSTATPSTSGADADDREPLLRADLTSDLQSRWTTIQQGFVDDPRNAVSDADGLVSEVLQRVQDSFTEQQHTLESQWNDGEPSTDDLRMALQRYRAFFRRLLEV